MSDNTATQYADKLAILGYLWTNYKGDPEFVDFIEYNDLGLPLAYAIDNGIVKSSDLAQRFVEETFDLLLAGLDVEDTGFETLDDILDSAVNGPPPPTE
jgi:hypothetical protein